MATARKWRDGWQARWYAPDGTQATKSGFPSERAALKFGTLMEADKLRGNYNDPRLGRIKFEEWAQHWLETKVRLKPKTLEGYASLLRTHLKPEFGNFKIARIDPIHVQEWVSQLDRAGLSTSRIRQAYQLLSTILKAAVESGYLGRTPCVGVTLPQAPKRAKLFLDETQVAQLASAIRSPYEVFVYVLAYGGLRWAEAVGLRRSACDLLRSRLHINETLSEVAGGLHRVPTKTYETREVVLPSFVRDMLDKYLEDKRPKRGRRTRLRSSRGGSAAILELPQADMEPCDQRDGDAAATPDTPSPAPHVRGDAHQVWSASQSGSTTLRALVDLGDYGCLRRSLPRRDGRIWQDGSTRHTDKLQLLQPSRPF